MQLKSTPPESVCELDIIHRASSSTRLLLNYVTGDNIIDLAHDELTITSYSIARAPPVVPIPHMNDSTDTHSHTAHYLLGKMYLAS